MPSPSSSFFEKITTLGHLGGRIATASMKVDDGVAPHPGLVTGRRHQRVSSESRKASAASMASEEAAALALLSAVEAFRVRAPVKVPAPAQGG